MAYEIGRKLELLNYKYKKTHPINGLTLHTEKLTFPSLIKDSILRIVDTKRLFISSSRGPARVESRLLENLKTSEIDVIYATDWILNVNQEKNWDAIDLETSNVILGPNVELGKVYVREKIQLIKNCVILVPSAWVIPVLTEKLPWYKGKYQVWQSDVDLDYWSPSKFEKRKYVLIYRKFDNKDGDFERIASCCESLGIKYRVIEYGKYSKKGFRKNLKRSHFVIWLGTTESQGIALLESWSTNTATFVRVKNTYIDDETGNSFDSSSAPYLTDSCGEFFNIEEFNVAKLKQFLALSKSLAPRKYVLDNYSKSRIDRNINLLFKNLYS